MTQSTNKYKVKEGKVIFHANKGYKAGSEVELTAEKALVHAANIDLVKPEKAAEIKAKPDAGKS